MIKPQKFVVSRPLYAVKLGSYRLSEEGGSYIDAVWFRRRKGVTVACAGTVWNYIRPRPQTAEEFLAAHDDNRYGGDCLARWDGAMLWTGGPLAQWTEEKRDKYVGLLKPMLDSFPEIPPGYDGWYGFE